MGNNKLKGANLETLSKRTGANEELLSTLSSKTGELLLDRTNTRKRGRPSSGSPIGSDGSEYTRATSVVNKTQWAKLQTIAKMERVSLKTLLEAIFALNIKNYEEKKGEIKVSTGEDLSSVLS